MTDLTKGIIDFGDIVVSKDTTREDLLNAFGDKLSALSNETILDFNMAFTVENQLFGCMFYIGTDNKISHIEMRPFGLAYKSERWDRTGRQRERREFCDKWLFERLGPPQKEVSGDIEYTFVTHQIACFSNTDVRDGGNAGYIVVRFSTHCI